MSILKKQVMTVSALGVLMALGVAASVALGASPAPVTDYVGMANTYKDASEPRGEAAWPVYREMLATDFGLASIEDDYSDAYTAFSEAAPGAGVLAGDLDDPRLAPVLAALPALEPALEKMVKAAAAPRMGKAYARVGDALVGEQDPTALVNAYDILLPELQPLRKTALMNALAMRVAADEGDWDLFVRRAQAGLAAGHHVARAGVLIETLVGVSMAAVIQHEITAEINERDIPAGVARRLETLLAAEGFREAFHHAAELEGMYAASMLESLYDPDGLLDVSAMHEELGEPAWENPAAEQLTAYLYPRLSQARRDLDANTRRFHEYVDAVWASGANAAVDPDNESTGNTVLDMLTPAYDRAAQVGLRTERDNRAVRLMLRLEAAHAETGDWPDTIDTPAFAGVNTDPITRQLFLYRTEPGGAYTLTSPPSGWKHDNGTDYTAPREPLSPEDPADDLPSDALKRE